MKRQYDLFREGYEVGVRVTVTCYRELGVDTYKLYVYAPNDDAAIHAARRANERAARLTGIPFMLARNMRTPRALDGCYNFDLRLPGELFDYEAPRANTPAEFMAQYMLDPANNQPLIHADLSKLEAQIMQTIPKAPTPYVAEGSDPVAAVAIAKQKLEAAEAALAAKIERDEFERRINAEMELASVTHTLLRDIRDSSKIGRTPDTRSDFAKFRKELQPLAESYGYKIVLVGDKSQATLVKV